MKSFNKVIALFALLGLLLGISLDVLWRYDITAVFPYSFISLTALLFGLAYNDRHILRLLMTSFLAAFVLCLPLMPIGLLNSALINEQLITFLCAFPLFVYVGHSFHYAYHHDRSINNIKYSTLFAVVWNSLPLLFIAGVFLFLGNLLIMLTAFTFKTVNSTFLWDLYFNDWHFRLIRHATLFFIGLGIGQQSVKTVYSLRYLLLRMMYYLLPFLALISALYFILYWIHVITGGKEYINPLAVLSPLVILGIIFFNGYFQDGRHRSEYPEKLVFLLKIYRFVLLFLSLMLVYQVLKLTSVPLNVCVYLLAIVFYGLAYSVTSVFSEEKERRLICRYNILIALFFMFALFILNNPLKPVNYMIGKGGLTAGSRFQSSIFPPSTEILTPGASQILYLQHKQQKNDEWLKEVGVDWRDKNTERRFQIQQDGEALSICRAPYNKGYQIGVYKDQQCTITYGGKVLTAKDYQLLAAAPDALQWSDKKSALELGIEFKPEFVRGPYGSTVRPADAVRALGACKVNLDGQIFIGKSFNNNCIIAYQQKEKAYQHFQTLDLAPELKARYQLKKIDDELRLYGLEWKPANSDGAFIAGYFANEPIYICRAQYKKAYHPGQYLNDQCTITYAGKAIVAHDFQILTATSLDALSWQEASSVAYYNNKALITGFELAQPGKKDSEINNLYSCRSIYDNRIHVGKLMSGQCNIAFDGNEVSIQSVQVLSSK